MAKKTTAKTATKKPLETRPVTYPTYAQAHMTAPCEWDPDGQGPVDVERTKDLLGWMEVDDANKDTKWYDVERDGVTHRLTMPPPTLTDKYGKKVRLLNNVTNRPIYNNLIDGYVQEILQGNWIFNAEPWIIGRTGLILNGQHTMIAHVLAEQLREIDAGPEGQGHWVENWPGPITLEKDISVGLPEDEKRINSMDTCKPRSLADVISRSPLFAGQDGEDHKKCSKILDLAIKFLWERTGLKRDAYTPNRTHAEAMDFVERHPKLLEAVKYVNSNNATIKDVGGAISRWLPPGKAAGMLYLMGASLSSMSDYLKEGRTEAEYVTKKGEKVYVPKGLDLTKLVPTGHKNAEGGPEEVPVFDRACQFWAALSASRYPSRDAEGNVAEDNDTMRAVRDLTRPGVDGNPTGILYFGRGDGAGSTAERTTILAKAWSAFLDVREPEAEEITPQYQEREGGKGEVVVPVFLSGIDVGPEPAAAPSPAQIAEAAGKISEEKANGSTKRGKGKATAAVAETEEEEYDEGEDGDSDEAE